MNEVTKKRLSTALTILKFSLLLLIMIGVPLFVYLRNPDIVNHFRSIEALNAFFARYKTQSIFIFTGFQVMQVIIAFVPGQGVQLAGGYLFHVPLAYLLSIVGIGIGTIITFYLGKLLGKDMLYLVFGEKRMERFVHTLNSRKGFLIVFLLYLFPGIPKDIFSYAAGVSEMRLLPFLLISLVGRTPALLSSLLVGGLVRSQSYVGVAIVIGCVLIAALIAVLCRKRFLAMVDRLYEGREEK